MKMEREFARMSGQARAPTPLGDDLAPGHGSRSSWLHVPAHASVGGPVQRKASATDGRDDPTRTAAPSGGSGGQAISPALRSQMEAAFGADFSAVRIHEGSQAEAVGALAYTQGTDIHFAPGQYQPDTPQGKKLLGHELAHVVQQGQGKVSATKQAKGVAINDDHALESEADEMGARAAEAQPASHAAMSSETRSLSSPAGGETVQAKCGACEGKPATAGATGKRATGNPQRTPQASGTGDTCPSCGAEHAPAQKKVIQAHGASTGAVVQRLTSGERAQNLESPRFAGNARLQSAFDNSPAMRRGESGDAVRLLQEALVELAFPLPRSTNPTTKELDGDFGAETQGAVFDFQGTFTLPSRDGVVGRQTLGKLDELHGGAPSAPLLQQQAPGTSAAQQVATANGARLSALSFAISTLTGLEQALAAGLKPEEIRASFAKVVAATERWLRAKPEDPDYANTITLAKDFLTRNLSSTTPIHIPPQSDTVCNTQCKDKNGNVARACSSSAVDVNVCQPFLTNNLDCQRDVLIHEFNHMIGAANEAGARGQVKTPADAFNNADSMAEYVTQLNGAQTDRCRDP